MGVCHECGFELNEWDVRRGHKMCVDCRMEELRKHPNPPKEPTFTQADLDRVRRETFEATRDAMLRRLNGEDGYAVTVMATTTRSGKTFAAALDACEFAIRALTLNDIAKKEPAT